MNTDKHYTVRRSDDQWTRTKVTAQTTELRWHYAELVWAIICFAAYVPVCISAISGDTFARGILAGVFAYYICNTVDRKLMDKASPRTTEPT